MDSQGVFYQQPMPRTARRCAARGHAVQQCPRQGQIREHRVDPQRQVWATSRRSIPAATSSATSIRSATTRTTLAASTPTTISATARHPARPGPDVDLLLAERHLARDRTQRAPCSTNCASARRTTGALRGIVGAFYEDNKLFDQTAWQYKTMPACTEWRAGTPGNTGCLSNVGTLPGAHASRTPAFRTTTPRSSRTRGARPSRWRSSRRSTSTDSRRC